MASRENERAAYKGRRMQDKEWWKPLARLPTRVRIEGRVLAKKLVAFYRGSLSSKDAPFDDADLM